jgi:hypothetical protein
MRTELEPLLRLTWGAKQIGERLEREQGVQISHEWRTGNPEACGLRECRRDSLLTATIFRILKNIFFTLSQGS